ncbi:MAG: hypothetical protein K2M73_09525 [Lachnospiraceae bacterium]|nr:hypothetical protein [Lachnospiraceae bacterium]
MENGFTKVKNNLIYVKELFDDRNSEVDKEHTEILSPDEAIKIAHDPEIEDFIRRMTTDNCYEGKNGPINLGRFADFICVLTIEKDEFTKLRFIYPLIIGEANDGRRTLYTQSVNYLANSGLYTKGDYAVFIDACVDVQMFNCSNSVTYRFEEDYNNIDPECLVNVFPENQPQPTGFDVR